MTAVFTTTLSEFIQLPKGDYIVEVGDGRIVFYEKKSTVEIEPKQVENGGLFEIEVRR